MSDRSCFRRAGAVVCAIALGLVAAAPLAAQTGRIQGEVRASGSGRPLAGAQVYLVDGRAGTVTGPDGRYLILNVPVGEVTVRVQMLGYTTVTRTVTVVADQAATLDFTLTESAVSLDEIVVTGTAGQARQREVGNSLSQISTQEIELAPVRNTQDVIGGRATGVTVLANSGQPGTGGTIRLRGNSSVSQSNAPLIYVDGVRIYSEQSLAGGASRQRLLPLNDIPAEDIERIEIVKGAAATTLYGTEASGGVIQIFTKRGQAGRPVWTVELGTGVNNLGHVGPKEDPTGLFMVKCRGPELVDSEGNPFEDVTCPSSGSWLRNGPIYRFNASVRGGGGDLTYFLSAGYNNENGAIETGYSRDGGFRGNFSFRPYSTLDFAVNTSYRKRSSRFIPDGNLANGFTLNVMRGPANNFKRPGACSTPEMVCTSNAEVLDQVSMARTDHFVTGFTMRWEPTPRMSHRLTLGYDYLRIENSYELPFGFLRAPLGQISINDQQHTTLSIDYVGSVRHDLGGLASTFSWGGQLFEDRDNYVSAVGRDFSGPGEPTLTSGAVTEVSTHSRLRVVNAGFFFQEMLGWRDRLFITAGLRVDGNSAFGENFGLQPYPKLSAAYVISDHEWWPSSIEAMKLRAAVGESGKAPGAFDAVRTWEPIAADDGKPGFTPAQLGNPDLGPERTREFEVGFEASAFEGRIGIDYTYYRQRTMDALIGMLAPPSQGFLNRQLMNVGTIDNRGHELRLDGAILRTPTAEWRARLNISTNDSKAVDLGGEDIPVGSGNYVREGYPVPSFFGIKILNPDEIAEPILSEETYIGPSYPTRIIGFGTTISLFEDRLVLDLLAEHQGGHYNANFVGYQNNLRGVWRPCYEINAKLRAFNAGDQSALNDVTARERARCAIDREKMHSDFWISPADFTKLRTVSLTYRLPPRLVPGARTAMLTLSGRNLFTWTDYDGVDPEVADMSDSSFGRREYYNLPPLRSFLASIRVTF